MSMRRSWIAAVALLACGVTARADYLYTSTIVVNTMSIPAGDTVVLAGTPADTLSGSNTVSLGTINITSTNTTPGTATVTYTDTITITNPTPGGETKTFTLTGTVTIMNFTGHTALTTNVYGPITPSSTQTIGGDTFTLSNLSFATPTVGDPAAIPPTTGSPGSFGAELITSVPEPGSMALIGIGLTGMIGYGWRRREVARRSRLA